MNLLTHFMLQSNLPNKQITAVSCCLVSLWKGTNPSNKRRIDDKNDCTLRVKAAEDIMKGKKEGVLKRKREREERKQLNIINSNKPKKLKMKKKPVVRKINKKTPTGGTVRKRPAMVMDDSSSEDLTEVESELEDTEEKGSEEACEEPVNNKTQMYEKDNYIPLVKGSYYLRQLVDYTHARVGRRSRGADRQRLKDRRRARSARVVKTIRTKQEAACCG